MSAQELCAVGAYKWIAGVLRHDVWIKNKPGAEALVRDLCETRWDSIVVDTITDGVFRLVQDGIATGHGREFAEWLRK